MELTKAFHDAFGVETPDEPKRFEFGEPDRARLREYASVARCQGEILKMHAAFAKNDGAKLAFLRLQLIQEELAELAYSLYDDDTEGTLDALADLDVVVAGTWLTLGLSGMREAAAQEVFRSNMSKLGADGKPIIGASGRVEKSDLFTPPDLGTILRKAKNRKAAE